MVEVAIPKRLNLSPCRRRVIQAEIEGMNTPLRKTALCAALAAAISLTGCSANPHSTQEEFSFSGETLNVVHNNSNMNVSVSSSPENDGVLVEVSTQTLGQKPETPAWSLSDGILNLGTPCGGSIVGYCEGSYSIAVPEGTEVLVNGQPVSMR